MAGRDLQADDTASMANVSPAELRVQNNGRLLKVTFEDGVVGSVSSSCLRDALSRVAHTGRTRREVAIVVIEQIEANAVRIGFDDGHDSGVYTWRLLRSLTTH